MFAIEITEAQLLITGLLSGGGVIGLVVKWLISSPERESAAYKAGVADEAKRCEADIAELRAMMAERTEEIVKLRNGLLRLAVAADLSIQQRTEIANALGFDPIAEARAQHFKDQLGGE